MRWKIKANGLASRVAAAIAGGVMAAFSVAGCGPGQNEDAAESYRTGLIFQITDSGVYVASEGIESATYIAFDGVSWEDSGGNVVTAETLSVGQQVRYNYTAVQESWPMQLVGCSRVVVTGHKEDVRALVDEWNRTQQTSDAGTGQLSLRLISGAGKRKDGYPAFFGGNDLLLGGEQTA